MLSQIVRALAGSELDGIRRKATEAGFALAAVFLASLAFVFGFVALFLWLMTLFAPWQAALIVGAALLAGALATWGLGRLVAGRRRRVARLRADAGLQALLDETARGVRKGDASMSFISTALAIGFAIGRRMSK